MDNNMDKNMITDMNLSALPLNTLEQIPTPTADAKEITALVKEGGRTVGYKLSDGQILNKPQALALAKQGGIKGVGIATNQGNEYLKSLPDASENNNLGSLPSITH